ncbi:MAG TPA: adenine deaminase [Ferruginibacter sp.]|nr:adenine deaminase [Ferruginibacter sp.]
MSSFSIDGNIVDITAARLYSGTVTVTNGIIEKIIENGVAGDGLPYIMPGFIDSHVHVESSMLVPSEFARLAVVHGTVGSISDPHEIANVCGMEGVLFMIGNGKTVPFKFNFGAPSCVPATVFETAGASLDAEAVHSLLRMPEIKYLSEMMNFPGVLHHDEEVMKKIAYAKQYNKPVDGHAPGLRGELAKAYIDAGISTDHECFTADEALDKLQYGMKILIREGSAAKNFEALIGLLHDHPDHMMFCSDDKHPDSLAEGHINDLCARAVAKGINIFKILKAACINPVKHYKMDIGLLQTGHPADFILVKDLVNFRVLQTYIDGILVAENGRSLINASPSAIINEFDCSPKVIADFRIQHNGEKEIPVIEALDGQLITNRLSLAPAVVNGEMVSDTDRDIIKIVVVNRYHDAVVAKSFIRNSGLKKGALASSVAHDSHNIVAIGTDDESLCKAVNAVIRYRGGVSAVGNGEEKVLPLPVAGLMSNLDGYQVAAAYTEIDKFSKEVLGSTLNAPFMTLSFMALLVIPHLKLSDKGLFDGDSFTFVE